MNERSQEAGERFRIVVNECEKILQDPQDPRFDRARYWLHKLLFEDPYRGYGSGGSVHHGVVHFASGGGAFVAQEMRYDGYGNKDDH